MRSMRGQADNELLLKAIPNFCVRYYNQLLDFYGKKMEQMEQEKRQIRAEMDKEENDFRRKHQGRDKALEKDLNDPDRVKNAEPPRLSDDDPRCTTSSLQMFDGEDLKYAERMERQKEQLAEWLQQQMAEREEAKRREQEDEEYYSQLQAYQGAIMVQNQEKEKEARQELNHQIAEENRKRAQERDERAQREREKELEENSREFEHTMSHPHLCEDDSMARTSKSNRVRPDHFKGLANESKEFIQTVWQDQLKEVKDKRRQEREERERQRQYERFLESAVQQKQAEVEQLRAQQCHNVAEFQRQQREEQRELERSRNEVYTTNYVDDSFFGKFGRDPR